MANQNKKFKYLTVTLTGMVDSWSKYPQAKMDLATAVQVSTSRVIGKHEGGTLMLQIVWGGEKVSVAPIRKVFAGEKYPKSEVLVEFKDQSIFKIQ